MNENTKYYIWLALALGYGSPKAKQVDEMFRDISYFHSSGKSHWQSSGIFIRQEIEALERTPLSKAEETVERCRELGFDAVSLGDAAYPRCLYEIHNPPAVIYIKGELPRVDDMLSIAIVGTRTATSYGVKVGYEISYLLSKLGAVVVSGGALGIDSAAHKGALSAGGINICVLGCGINYNYLYENAPLRKAVSQMGALVSEYPPDYPVRRHNFPLRNRIISGLSNGTLVIESGIKSGSLITANYALEQGRDVFAVPGNVSSSVSAGTNDLIKHGAVPVTSVSDIISFYEGVFELSAQSDEYAAPPRDNITVPVKTGPSVKKGAEKTAAIPEPVDLTALSSDAKKVYGCLSDVRKHIDLIIADSGLEVRCVMQAITELEIINAVEAYAGRQYSVKTIK